MPFIREEKDGYAEFRMNGAMTIYEAASIRNAFLESFESFDGIVVDLQGVTECDIAGLQLILSAKKTAANRKKKFEAYGASDAVIDAISRAGLETDTMIDTKKEA